MLNFGGHVLSPGAGLTIKCIRTGKQGRAGSAVTYGMKLSQVLDVLVMFGASRHAAYLNTHRHLQTMNSLCNHNTVYEAAVEVRMQAVGERQRNCMTAVGACACALLLAACIPETTVAHSNCLLLPLAVELLLTMQAWSRDFHAPGTHQCIQREVDALQRIVAMCRIQSCATKVRTGAYAVAHRIQTSGTTIDLMASCYHAVFAPEQTTLHYIQSAAAAMCTGAVVAEHNASSTINVLNEDELLSIVVAGAVPLFMLRVAHLRNCTDVRMHTHKTHDLTHDSDTHTTCDVCNLTQSTGDTGILADQRHN